MMQFHVDDRPRGPLREQWKEAAQDAVNDKCASWTRTGLLMWHAGNGGSIETVQLSEGLLSMMVKK